MRPRAIIFDIYGTILDVAPGPGDADERWRQLFHEHFKAPPPLTPAEFAAECGQIIGHQHSLARMCGVPWPEIVWPSVVCQVLPAVASLSIKQRDDFIFRERQLSHGTTLNQHAAALLPRLRQRGDLLGIASNAQAYTLRELAEAFAVAGLNWREYFHDALCFWSFEHGFSKPDPHVFQILAARLQACGVASDEILMVGDRLDNDIEPASAHGWKSWWLTASPKHYVGGNWKGLSEALEL